MGRKIIYQDEAISIVKNVFDRDQIFQPLLKERVVRAIQSLPPAEPEPAIPLQWIEEHIEWLKSLDNEFANLTAANISTMVNKWRGEHE